MADSAVTLEERFLTFLGQQAGAESIDETLSDRELKHGQRADVLLDMRRIVMEVKTLKSDPQRKIEDRLKEHRARPEFPMFFWEAGLHEIVPHLPDGAAIRRDVFHAVTRAVQGGFEKADDQIAATKKALHLPNACGVVAFLNEDVSALSPELVTARVSQMFLKKRGGTIRYENIAYAWIVSEAHSVRGGAAFEGLPLILLEGPKSKQFAAAGEYLASLQSAWAAFERKPFRSIGHVQNFEGMLFPKRKMTEPPSTKKAVAHDAWRRQYRERPHLSEMTEDEFIEYAVAIVTALKPHFTKGGQQQPLTSVDDLKVRWAHVLEECERRRLDVRKVMMRL